jgi:uncharacterized membrane protein (DUF106 family)
VSVIISGVIGAILAGITLLVSQYISNKQKIGQLQDVNSAAADRIEAAEKRAQLDRATRLQDVQNDATKIAADGDAAAALELLRRHFPSSSGPSSGG